MSVKRYEWVACDEHACHCDVVESTEGDMVDYEDYAALEQRLIESERYGRQTDITIDNLELKLAQMAAENAGLKSAISNIQGAIELACAGINDDRRGCVFKDILNAVYMKTHSETQNTYAFLAEVRAQARNEGINYAAGRLAAAFNHGFVDKPLAEVYDVVRMIMTTKEDLANDTSPATDGLSGEYAEAFLEDSADEIRKGVQS